MSGLSFEGVESGVYKSISFLAGQSEKTILFVLTEVSVARLTFASAEVILWNDRINGS